MKFTLCLLFLIGLASCEKKFSITKDTEVYVGKGTDFSISLKGNPTTGYTWVLLNPEESSKYLKATNLKEKNQGEYVIDKQNLELVGAGGTFVFKFDALESTDDATPLKFAYLRLWEKQENIVPKYTVEVNVVKE